MNPISFVAATPCQIAAGDVVVVIVETGAIMVAKPAQAPLSAPAAVPTGERQSALPLTAPPPARKERAEPAAAPARVDNRPRSTERRVMSPARKPEEIKRLETQVRDAVEAYPDSAASEIAKLIFGSRFTVEQAQGVRYALDRLQMDGVVRRSGEKVVRHPRPGCRAVTRPVATFALANGGGNGDD